MAGESASTEYVAGILEKSDYWRPPSRGAGARGSKIHNGGMGDVNSKLSAAAQAGDHGAYRKLRKEQIEKQGG